MNQKTPRRERDELLMQTRVTPTVMKAALDKARREGNLTLAAYLRRTIMRDLGMLGGGS